MDLREYARTKFAEIFGVPRGSSLVVDAEKGVYNYTVQTARAKAIVCDWSYPGFKTVYKHKLKSLLENLKNDKNPNFLKHVLTKQIEGRHLAFLTPAQVWPERWAEVHERAARRFPINAAAEVAESALLSCTECRSKRVSHYSLQDANEETRFYLTCHECGRRWKI
jgi:DNA-directed RNA polymerase subunit M/transcription elongation factor TFIIS